MLKFLVLLALVLTVLYFFSWARRHPPGDWRRGDDREGGPEGPLGQIGRERAQERPASDTDAAPPETEHSVSTSETEH